MFPTSNEVLSLSLMFNADEIIVSRNGGYLKRLARNSIIDLQVKGRRGGVSFFSYLL